MKAILLASIRFVFLASVGLAIVRPSFAAVLADGPIAYYRFSDTMVYPDAVTAVNAGSLGAAANGTDMGGAAPGDEAPRTPAFIGFEADNTALQLDGAAGFVTTVAGLLNGRPKFTVSGRVRRAADQANRTGLFGQNQLIASNTVAPYTVDQSAQPAQFFRLRR